MVKARARGEGKKKANNPGKKRTKSGNDVGRAGKGADAKPPRNRERKAVGVRTEKGGGRGRKEREEPQSGREKRWE